MSTPYVFVTALGVGLASALVMIPVYRSSERVVSITVEDKERVGSKDSSRYVVWTTEAGEFEVTDTISFGDFRASTRYGKLRIGDTCSVRVAGWRFGLFSMYPNIVEVIACEPTDAERRAAE